MNIEIQKIIEIVRNTRSISLPHFGNVEVKAFKTDNATDAVTEIDQLVESHLRSELAGLMPEVAFVGEEFGGSREEECFWLVDPIDGTGHYIRGIPFCTTMLALIRDRQVVFSVIYDFVNDIIYHAELGKGSYENGKRIFVSERPLKEAYLSFETKSNRDENKALLAEVRSRAGMLQLVCAGMEFVLVAKGKMEGRLMYDPYGYDYDFAPGSLLVSEAGGVVRNFKSDSYDYTNLNFIASNKKVYDELVKGDGSIEKLMS